MADFFAKGNKPINGYGGGNLASKSDLTDIFESGTTASRAISAGTFFYLDGTLVRAKTDIASGATFTLDTNYEIVPALNRLQDVELNTMGVIGKNWGATSYTIDGWSSFFSALIVGFMDNVGGFIGAINGTTYTHISGTDMTQNNRLTLSLSGTTLTLNGVSTFSFTFIKY